MFETMVLISQTIFLALMAAWLTIGVYDNIRYPKNNENYTSQVLSMELLQSDFPEVYNRVSHRAIVNRTIQKLAFLLVIIIESFTSITLWVGFICLIMALNHAIAFEVAHTIALVGATAFTTIWAGFLVMGNYFCYWYVYEGIQNTHYQMTLWGIANVIFLVITVM
ncbi:MAG: DUF2165 family protein [Aestuariivita sp.]|nr:DUF2165 family protein [Aestuariivita sp.]